jgi:hypothetical protein
MNASKGMVSVIDDCEDDSSTASEAFSGHSSFQTSTALNQKSSSSGGADAESFAGQETRMVKYSKVLALLVLVLATSASAFCTYRFSVKAETHSFEIQVRYTKEPGVKWY